MTGPTEVKKKSLHRQSFAQHNLPTPKGIAQVNPFWQRVSCGLLKSRVWPLQSLSELHRTVQYAPVLRSLDTPGCTAGLVQIPLGQSLDATL
jgi:hypothetical protein